MAFGLGVPELIIVLVIFLIVFGVGRLPEVGSALGQSIREFREHVSEDQEEQETAAGKIS